MVMLASENAFDLAQVLDTQQANSSDTSVRSRRGAGLRETQGPSLLWFWQIKPPTVRENSPNRTQGPEGSVGFSKK